MAWINLATWLPCTEVEGPGRRAALWLQGCDKRCPGCCNPRYFPLTQRNVVAAAEMVERLRRAWEEFDLEGVTFLGGEPFLQAQGLAEIARGAREIGLSVMTFTGYTLTELGELALPGTEQFLHHIDVLIDGPYLADQPETRRNWVGSANQGFHYLTPRYSPQIETMDGVERGIEWRIRADGGMAVNGWPWEITAGRRVTLSLETPSAGPVTESRMREPPRFGSTG